MEQREEIARNASLRRYDRTTLRSGRVAALDLLHQKMVANAKLYQGDDQDKRDAITTQLIAVRDFLESQGFALPTLEPLMRPVSALVEREHNRLDPIFAERKRGGRPKRSLDDEHRVGAIVALTEVWLDSLKGDERTQRQKLAALSRRISGGWLGQVTLAKIENARESVSQEASDHPAVSWANLYRAQCRESLAVMTHDSVIDLVLEILNRTHPKI